MMRILALVLTACTGTGVVPVDTGDTAGDTGDVGDSGDSGDSGEPLRDVDEDGFLSDVDCDDYDPTVHPGATELWNREDDDCDGVIDGDGAYEGATTVNARVVYEGTPYRFTLACPTTLSRTGGTMAFVIRCPTDPEDAMAQLLLGSEITATPDQNYVEAEKWAGSVTVASTSGWDTRGTGSVTWTSFAEVALALRLSVTYLTLDGAGSVAR